MINFLIFFGYNSFLCIENDLVSNYLQNASKLKTQFVYLFGATAPENFQKSCQQSEKSSFQESKCELELSKIRKKTLVKSLI